MNAHTSWCTPTNPCAGGLCDGAVDRFIRFIRNEARAGVMAPMPNKPKTPLRSFRIPDELYVAAQVKAAEKGESVSDVVRKALERYVSRA